MKVTFDLKANVGDFVRVPALELKSVAVQSISVERLGVQYQIAYFHNGERKNAWLFPEEFERAEKPAQE